MMFEWTELSSEKQNGLTLAVLVEQLCEQYGDFARTIKAWPIH